MTFPLDDPADAHLDADLRSREGGSPDQRRRWFGTFVSGMTEGLVPAPSIRDVVVVRRRDGVEVARTAAGDESRAEDRLEEVRAELRTATVGEITAAWDLDPAELA